MVDHDFEYILSDTLQDVERQCLLGLHEIYHNNSYKPTSLDQENFIERMKMTVRLDREDEAFDIIYNFIQNLSSFFGTLNYYISVPFGPEYEEDRIFHEIKLKAQIKMLGNQNFSILIFIKCMKSIFLKMIMFRPL